MRYLPSQNADPGGATTLTADPPLDPGERLTMPDGSSAPVVMIEEYSGIAPVRVSGRADRRLALAIAVGVAVIGLGITGRIGTSPSRADASIGSAAAPSIGHVSTPMPAAIVAAATPSPTAAAPSADTFVAVFEVSSITRAGSTAVRLQRSIVSAGSEDVTVMVDGHAPFNVATVTIDVRTTSGSLLASTVVPTMGDERPGIDGLPRVGYRTIAWHIDVPGPIPADGWLVEMAWRDGSAASLGSVTQRIPATLAERSGRPAD